MPADAAGSTHQSLGSGARDVDATRVDRPTSPPAGRPCRSFPPRPGATDQHPAPDEVPTPQAAPGPAGRAVDSGRPARLRHGAVRGLLPGVSTVAALPPDSTAASSGMNVLIVGSDSRAGLSEEQQNELSTGSVEGNRTDTIMLLHVPLLGEPTLVSIPATPGYRSRATARTRSTAPSRSAGRNCWCGRWRTSGASDHRLHRGRLRRRGGHDRRDGRVVLCPRRDFNDENSGLNVKAGCQTMDGPTALAYVRMRYADPRGDLGRVERQQEYVAAVAKRGMSR